MIGDPSAIVQKISVTWADCDALGIVYYPHFYRWFDTCTHALMRRQGMDQREVQRRFGIQGYGLIDTGAIFTAPARYYDELTCTSSIVSWSNRTFRLEHIFARDDTIICSGHEVRGWFIADDSKPSGIRAGVIPEEFKAAFK